jgi:sugar phosphate isomerase/epimerase
MAAFAAMPLLKRIGIAAQNVGLALISARGLVARDFEATLQAIAAIGYRDLDMYIYEARRTPAETRAALDRAGLACRSARVTTPTLYRGWDRFLDAANVLGARWITLAWIPWEERMSLVDWRELADVFNRAGEAAKQRGLGFCYHNHDEELHSMEGQVPLDLLLGATDPQLVKLQMDVYWMTKGGRNPATEIARIGSRVASLHLKDMDATSKRDFATVGTGIIDFAGVLAAAKGAGVTDWFVEEEGKSQDSIDAMCAAYNHLRGLL